MNPEQDLISLPGSCEGSAGEVFSVEPQLLQTDAIITVEETEEASYIYRDTPENSLRYFFVKVRFFVVRAICIVRDFLRKAERNLGNSGVLVLRQSAILRI